MSKYLIGNHVKLNIMKGDDKGEEIDKILEGQRRYYGNRMWSDSNTVRCSNSSCYGNYWFKAVYSNLHN